MPSNRNKSLQDLDGQDWGEPTYDTHLVKECHRLHRVPLRDLTVGDLRIQIGQNIGLTFLMPLAIERLRADPFAEGNFYPGDLLVAVLGAERGFWRKHPEWRREAIELAEQVLESLSTLDEEEWQYLRELLPEAIAEFR